MENTFTSDLANVDQCSNELPLLGQQLISQLRRIDDDYKIVRLFVKNRFADFNTTTLERSATLLSLEGLSELCKEAYARKNITVRLLGIGLGLTDLSEGNVFQQLDVFKLKLNLRLLIYHCINSHS